MAWESLGKPAPRALADTRLQLHHAAQIVAAVGKSLLPPRADDGHPNLGWLAAERALVGHPTEGETPLRAGIQPEGLRLLLLDARGDVVEAEPLAGKTQAAGLAWLGAALERQLGGALPTPLALPGYELPDHPVGAGAPFEPDAEALGELARWFTNAERAIGALAIRTPGASDVRCWPHHFDLATLVVVETGSDGAATRTIGVGFSPGDAGYPEPYWYVTPWPYPDAEADAPLPDLPDGAHWHREGYTAAILTGSRHVGASDPDAFLNTFLASAFAACRRVHGL